MLENRALELVIVLLLVMLLFGAKRLPDTARALGKSLRILKAESRAMTEDAKAEAGTSAIAAHEAAGGGVTGVAASVGAADLLDEAAPAQRPSADSRGRL